MPVAKPLFYNPVKQKLMTKKDLVEAISTQTGISKRDLARWIGTDQSILSRYLNGSRSLPLKALQQLLFLHQQLSDLPALPQESPAANSSADWQTSATACRQRLVVLQARYAAMQQVRNAAAKALQLLAALAEDVVMLTPKKERWIAEQCYLAGKLEAENNLKNQQKLWVQITLLQKEIELYESLANGVGDTNMPIGGDTNGGGQ